MRVGERLLEAGLITANVLDAGLRTQGQYGGRLLSVLVDLGALDGDAATRILSTQKRAPAALKKHFDAADRHALARVPAKVAEKYGAVPLGFSGPNAQSMVVAMIDPGDFRAVEELQFITGVKIMPGAALENRVREALRRHYNVGPETRQFLGVAQGSDLDEFESTSHTVNAVHTSAAASEGMRARPQLPDLTLDRAPASAPAPQSWGPAPAPARKPQPLSAPPAPSHLSAPAFPQASADSLPPTEPPPPSAPPPRSTPAIPQPRSAPPATGPASPPTPPPPRLAGRAPTPPFERSPYAATPDHSPSSRDMPTMPAMPAVSAGAPSIPISEVDSLPPFAAAAPSAPPTVSWSLPPSAAPRGGFVKPIPRGDPEEARAAAAQAAMAATPDVLVASEAIRRIEEATSLEHKVDLLLVYMKAFFEACVVFAVRNDIAFTWKAFGPGIRGAVPPKIAIPLTQPSLLRIPYEARTVFCGTPTNEGASLHGRLWETLRTRPPREAIAIPIVIEDKVAAIVYAHPRGDQRVASSVLVEASSVVAAMSRRPP